MSSSLHNDEAQFYSELLRAFFDSTNDAIFVLCDEMKFLISNKMTQKWLGITEEKLIEHNNRTPITELLGDRETVAIFKNAFDRVLNNEQALFDVFINPERGKERWVEISLKRVDVEAGDMVICVARDITERKRDEEEKQRLQRELHQAQKMEALGQLTGGIAHDFNNILGIISGFTELAQHRHQDQNGVVPLNYIENIHQSAERAKKLISQLLMFSRRDLAESVPLQIESIIKDDVKMLQATMPSSIEFEVNIQPDVPDVLMEPVKLNQLLMNLCINARDAMHDSGKITISLAMHKNLSGECSSCHRQIQGDWVELVVSDTGSGIKPEVIGQIFDPFFTTKMVGKGTGMGLAMVSGIVEGYQGHIIVESEQAKGTSIHVLFPPVNDSEKDALNPAPEAVAGQQRGQGQTILIVDDEPDLVNFMTEVLEINGYECTAKISSAEAMDLFKSSPDAFDLVITDQTMPELTGTELISKIREIRPDQPIIVTTGFVENVEQMSEDFKDINCLQKPVKTGDLLKSIHLAIGQHKVSD